DQRRLANLVAEASGTKPRRRVRRTRRAWSQRPGGRRMNRSISFFLRVMLARAYPRVIGFRRSPGWFVLETVLPILSVSAFAFAYQAMNAPHEYLGFVVLGGAMTAFWLNVIWSMGA